MNFEKLNPEKTPDTEPEIEIESVLDDQEQQLKEEIAQKGYGRFSKIARKLAFTGVMMLPAFAVGCGAVEKAKGPETQERPAATQTKDGFLENAHDYVQRAKKIKLEEIKGRHKISKIIKESTAEEKAAAKKTVEEMRKPMIDQE